jgi:hypothetical protein
MSGIRTGRFILLIFIISFPFIYLKSAAAEGGHSGHDSHKAHQAAAASKPLMEIKLNPAKPKTGEPVTMSLSIKDQKGSPVRDLTISHERLVHVVIVSEDFSEFAHIHPEDFGRITDEMKLTATFDVKYTFSKAGRYLIAADYAIKENHFSEQFPVQVSGSEPMGEVNRDYSMNRKFGDYEVSLSTAPAEIRAGEKTSLTFSIEKDSRPVTDLEPYLAAPMHLAVIRTDLNQFIHAHADRPGSGAHPAGHIHAGDEKYGPELEAEVIFPVPGDYKLFSQVNHQGKVLLFDFLLNVR